MRFFKKSPVALAIASISCAPAVVLAQEDEEDSKPDSMFEKIIVTASPSAGATVMESSISVTTLDAEAIDNFTPRSEAEVYLMIPGIRAENTGGAGGNSNITVRGLPIASGGSKYVQLQEDGLPVVEFGDIAFANNDYWVRYDFTVRDVQALRGGSAATFASHAPGAVINYISKTGEDEGGTLGLTKGLDYDDTRIDFEYGNYINDNLRFHIGGYFRSGEGPREVDWNAQQGHQIKANITHDFEDGSGHVRVYFKSLDETAPTYFDYPMSANANAETGTLSNLGTVTNFDARSDSTLSTNIRTVGTLQPDGSFRQEEVDGIVAKVNGFGLEFVRDLGDVWRIENRFRINDTQGSFTAHWSNPDTMDITDFGAAYGVYFNGPQAGEIVTSENSIAGGGTGFFTRNALAHVRMNDVGNYANDLSLNAEWEDLGVKVGYYRSGQTINMDWMVSEVVYELSGNNPALIDLFDDAGNALTTAGLTGYNNQWGGCCGRSFDQEFTTDALYAGVNYMMDDLTLDAAVRFETFNADGTYTSASPVEGGLDVNGDGVIEGAERNVNLIDFSTTRPIDYELDYTSWSFGANYMFSEDLAVFGRISRGHRAGADRIAENASLFNANGGLIGPEQENTALNQVDQIEIGVKLVYEDLQAFVTLFNAEVTEFSTEINAVDGFFNVQNDYEASGVELESIYSITDNWNVNFNLTYNNAEISDSTTAPDNIGNTPLATPRFMYLLSTTYSLENGALGATLRGTSDDWYANDANTVRLPEDRFVNVFARYHLMEDLEVSLNVNNLFNDFGTSGRMNGFGPVVSIRPQLGRTVSASIRYSL